MSNKLKIEEIHSTITQLLYNNNNIYSIYVHVEYEIFFSSFVYLTNKKGLVSHQLQAAARIATLCARLHCLIMEQVFYINESPAKQLAHWVAGYSVPEMLSAVVLGHIHCNPLGAETRGLNANSS